MSFDGPLKSGDIIHIPGTGPAHDRARGHFHVLIAEIKDKEVVLLVPICSVHERCDKTCILPAGVHDCVRHDSFIMYAKLNYYSFKHIEEKIASGVMEKLPPASSDLMTRIADGVLVSSFAAPVYQKAIRAYRAKFESEVSEPSEPETEITLSAANSPTRPG